MNLLSIFGFGTKSEANQAQTASEKNLRRLSDKYKKASDLAIAKRRAERLILEANAKARNTRRKPKC